MGGYIRHGIVLVKTSTTTALSDATIFCYRHIGYLDGTAMPKPFSATRAAVAPPPTRYGPAAGGQAKPAAAPKPIAPPPTRYGAPPVTGAVQPKFAAHSAVAPPPVRFAAAIQVKPVGPRGTIQRMKQETSSTLEQKRSKKLLRYGLKSSEATFGETLGLTSGYRIAPQNFEKVKIKKIENLENTKIEKIEDRKKIEKIEKIEKVEKPGKFQYYIDIYRKNFTNLIFVDIGTPNSVELLKAIRRDFSVGSENDYDILSQSDWRKQVKKLTEKDIDNSNAEGGSFCPRNFELSDEIKPFLFVSEKIIADDIKIGSIAKILSTLRHEHRHTQQCRCKTFDTYYSQSSFNNKDRNALNTNTSEFEAYMTELISAYGELSRDTAFRPNNRTIFDSFVRARQHFAEMGLRQKLDPYDRQGKLLEDLFQVADLENIDQKLLEFFGKRKKDWM